MYLVNTIIHKKRKSQQATLAAFLPPMHSNRTAAYGSLNHLAGSGYVGAFLYR